MPLEAPGWIAQMVQFKLCPINYLLTSHHDVCFVLLGRCNSTMRGLRYVFKSTVFVPAYYLLAAVVTVLTDHVGFNLKLQ